MAPKKLSESEKQEILQLYKNPDESTSTLASRFGVSSSTISRVLKQGFSDDDYNALVQQKRAGGQPIQHTAEDGVLSDQADGRVSSVGDGSADVMLPTPGRTPPVKKAHRVDAPESLSASKNHYDNPSTDDPSTPERGDGVSLGADQDADTLPVFADGNQSRRRRRRSPKARNADNDIIQLPIAQLTDINGDRPTNDDAYGFDEPDTESSPDDEDYAPDYPPASANADAFIADIDDSLLDAEDDFTDDLDDEDDDDDDFLDDDDDDDISGDASLEPLHFKSDDLVQVYPFSTAELPRTCYLVIDRSAELITRPLQEFGELGDLPSAELSENTLPVFDNHRVAKRFANRRTQRIVKIPDSRILRKTMPYLQAKGITRLLIDGQVYSLID